MDPRPRLVLASSSPRRAELLRTIGVRFDVHPTDVDESLEPGEPAHDYVVRVARAKANAAAGNDCVVFGDCIVIGADTAVVVDDEILGKPADATQAREMLHRLAGRAHEVKTGLVVLAPPERLPGGTASRCAGDAESGPAGTAQAAESGGTAQAAESGGTARAAESGITARAAESGITARAAESGGTAPAAIRTVDTVVSTHVWFTDLDEKVIDWYVGTGEPRDKAGAYGIQGMGGLFVEYLHGSYHNVVGLPLADLNALLSEVGHQLLDWVA
jgi:septum formation protein